MSYGDLRTLADLVAADLAAAGIGRGDRVAIVLPNGATMATAFATVIQAATTAPLNPAYREDEFAFYLEDLGARAIIVEAGYDGPALAAARRFGLAVIRLAPVDGGPAGAFTLTATCSINEGGTDFARVLIATTVANSSFDGNDTTEDLDPATLAADRDYMISSAATGTPNIDQESDGTAWAPDGTEIMGNDAFAAVNLPADGVGTCRYGGAFYVNAG